MKNRKFQHYENVAWKIFNWSVGVSVINAIAIFMKKYLIAWSPSWTFMFILLLLIFCSGAAILFFSPINSGMIKGGMTYAFIIPIIYFIFEIYFILFCIFCNAYYFIKRYVPYPRCQGGCRLSEME